MRHRPQSIIRFRCEAQVDDIKAAAEKAKMSVNEWMLIQIETSNPTIRVEDATTVKPKAKEEPKPHDPETCRVRKCGMCKVMKGA